MHIVYLLESETDRGWYIGYTGALERRLREHNAGANASTRGRRPFRLIYAEAYLNKTDALRRERFLKSGSGRGFLKKQLSVYISGTRPEQLPKPGRRGILAETS